MVTWFLMCQNGMGGLLGEFQNLRLVSQVRRWAHGKGAVSQSLWGG